MGDRGRVCHGEREQPAQGSGKEMKEGEREGHREGGREEEKVSMV
jgi:hypothetical protein